ncbi:ankyrin repeat-containing protein [Legionella beliardensis]|uniref:Ankyrin repeat-containing protein n=1 Tax=Legionella beliardensis TaxID=91822 RepID=A0A378I3N6_9GAMM|nr:ankyrin repeat domain-containing protein [Legionella beliardensis]STX29778.1 ankyrin repeat-containing protein [Legionella beliardensis]
MYSLNKLPKLFGHQWLINIIKELDYPLDAGDIEGMCFGFAVAGLLYGLAGQSERFGELINFLKTTEVEQLKDLITQAKEKSENNDSLNSDEKMYLYLDKLLILLTQFQNPENVNKKYTQRHPEEMLPPLLHEMIDGLKENEWKKLIAIDDFSGAYSLDEISEYLTQIKLAVNNADIHHPIGFILRSASHAITLTHDPEKNLWQIMNADFEVVYSSANIEEIAKGINLSLALNMETTYFSTQIFVTDLEKDKANKLIAQLNKSESLIKIHQVTKEKAQSFHPGNKRSPTQSWLLAALFMRQGSIIQQVLENGADPNFKDFKGNTPLLILLNSNEIDLSIVKILLVQGADINIRNKNKGLFGRPLALAVEKGNTLLLEMMLSIPDIKPSQAELNYALERCITIYDKNIVDLLLKYGANPHCLIGGGTILHEAVKAKNVALVNDILDCGFFPDKLDELDETALHTAINVDSMECIESFISHGIPLFYTDENIQSMKKDSKPSSQDQSNQDSELSSDADDSDEEIAQPIQLAAELGKTKIVLRLIKAGCPCNQEVFEELEKNVSEEDMLRVKSAAKTYQMSKTPQNYSLNTSAFFDKSEDKIADAKETASRKTPK